MSVSSPSISSLAIKMKWVTAYHSVLIFAIRIMTCVENIFKRLRCHFPAKPDIWIYQTVTIITYPEPLRYVWENVVILHWQIQFAENTILNWVVCFYCTHQMGYVRVCTLLFKSRKAIIVKVYEVFEYSIILFVLLKILNNWETHIWGGSLFISYIHCWGFLIATCHFIWLDSNGI